MSSAPLDFIASFALLLIDIVKDVLQRLAIPRILSVIM